MLKEKIEKKKKRKKNRKHFQQNQLNNLTSIKHTNKSYYFHKQHRRRFTTLKATSILKKKLIKTIKRNLKIIYLKGNKPNKYNKYLIYTFQVL